ncbi:MAG: helix-turn-helix domain-containing protein [Christensenellaceae bacterium]
MEKTIGQIIREKRAEKGLTQEQLAEQLGVTGQAVSKWERDESYPDISLLKELAKALSTSVGVLVGEEMTETAMIDPEQVDLDRMLLKIRIDSQPEENGKSDKVVINLPIGVIRILVENQQLLASLAGEKTQFLTTIDWKQILSLISLGVVGKIVDIESADGDTVGIWVE